MVEASDWAALWSQASSARSRGEVSRALRLFDVAIAAAPSAGEPFAEAASLCGDTARSLVGVGRLYDAHRKAFGLTRDDCPAAAMHEDFVRGLGESAVSHLLSALEFAPGHAAWHTSLAEALERLDRGALALAYRRRAAELVPTSLRAAWRLADALEAQGSIDEALAHCRSMQQRWPWEASIANRIKRLTRHSGDAAVATPHIPDADDAGEHSLATFLESALAASGSSKADEEERRALVSMAKEIAARLPGSSAAQLALGCASLAAGRRGLARRSFLAASLLQVRGTPPSAEVDATSAMTLAQAFIVDPRHAGGDGVPTAPDERALTLAHAAHCRSGGEVFEALRGCDKAMAGYVVRSLPISYELYRDYKILSHAALYYAIPAHVAQFRIIDGVVCHFSSTVDQARYRVPRWMIDLARRINRWLWRLDRRGLQQPLVRLLRRLVTRLYAVPGVQVADTYETVIALIDRVRAEPVR